MYIPYICIPYIYVYPKQAFFGEQDNENQHRIPTLFPYNTRDNVISLSSPTAYQTPYALAHCLSSGLRKN